MKVNPLAVSCLLPGLLLLAGCQGMDKDLPERGEVSFSILGTDTRTTSTDGESNVDHWTLLLYRNGKLADVGTSDSKASIRRTLDAGTYTAYAVANPPSSFRPERFTTLTKLSAAESSLGDNAPGRLVMAGKRTITVPVANNRPQTISVDRLVSKVGIQKISTAFASSPLSSRTFLLKAIYLTNCYAKSRLGSDLDESGLVADASCWYNRMRFSSDGSVNALLSDRSIDTEITASVPYRQAHYYYCYPNPAVQDSRSGDWSIRHTRLVLEAEIDGKTYYYPVTLPQMQRNKTYIVEEAIIRNLGSLDPEMDEPGSIEVVFRTDTDAWDPEYTVQENS